MVGAQTNLQAFDQGQKLIKISAGPDQMQEVFAQPTAEFPILPYRFVAKQNSHIPTLTGALR